MKKNYKVSMIAGICIFSSMAMLSDIEIINTSYATEASSRNISIEKEALLNEIIKKYGLIDVYDKDFAKYLNQKGVSEADYKTCVKFLEEHKKDNMRTFYEIENNVYSFDTILYTNPIIKSIYSFNLTKLNGNKEKAWDETVSSLIFDYEWLNEAYSENIKSRLDIEKLFKYKFKREMSVKELEYSKDTSKYKYIWYSGILGKDLEDSDIKKIDRGNGYELLGLTKEDYSEYKSYISKRKKILKYAESYIKKYKIHENVRKELLSKYGIDIFKKLTELDRDMVYKESLINYLYNEKKAKEMYISIFKSRGFIKNTTTSKPSSGITGDSIQNTPNKPNGEKENVLSNGSNLTDKDYEYIKDLLKPILENSSQEIYGIKNNKYTSSYYAKLVKMLELYDKDANKQVIMISVGDEKIYTIVEVEKDKIGFSDFRFIMHQIEIEFSGKIVESQKELLLFVNNAIATIEKKDEGYGLSEINKSLETANVKWKVVPIEVALKEYAKELEESQAESIEDNQ